MHRRRKLRRSLMPQPMEVDGGDLSGINKPLRATTREHKPTNI
jgi:hypothetical protein